MPEPSAEIMPKEPPFFVLAVARHLMRIQKNSCQSFVQSRYVSESSMVAQAAQILISNLPHFQAVKSKNGSKTKNRQYGAVKSGRTRTGRRSGLLAEVGNAVYR
jgi:hypothetical protein